MKIEIEGNPGTGNTFSETHIEHVENYNPGAQTVINNYYGTRARKKDDKPQTNDGAGIDIIRQEVLDYVRRLKPCLEDAWKQGYDQMWTGILAIPTVIERICNPGKQQGTNFNRNLIANIIHYLGARGAFGDYNAARLAERLEGDKDHSVRRSLGEDPDTDIKYGLETVLKKAVR